MIDFFQVNYTLYKKVLWKIFLKNYVTKIAYFYAVIIIYSCAGLPKLSFQEKGWQQEEISTEDTENAYKTLTVYLEKKYPDIIITDIISVKKQNIGGMNIVILCAYHFENSNQKILKGFLYKDLHGKYFVRKVDFDRSK